MKYGERASPSSSARSIIGRRLDEIINRALKNPNEAMKEARRLRAWLKSKRGAGQAHPDIDHVIGELGELIDLIRKEADNPPESGSSE